MYGEGEWKVRKHGTSKRRTWRKIHLAVCPDSHDIILASMSGNDTADCEELPKMQTELPKSVKRGYGDDAYDTNDCYQAFYKKGLEPVIPPQRNGVLHNDSDRPWMEFRNNAIRAISGLGGDEEARRLWKKLVGYHRRSLAETTMYRFKRMFGGSLSCREEPYQRAEVFSKCLVINKMNSLGMPRGNWVIA